MTPGGPIGLVVITRNEREHGEKFVVREHVFSGKNHRPMPRPLGIVDTIEAARKLVPRGLALLDRQRADRPELVESWGSALVVTYLLHVGRTL